MGFQIRRETTVQDLEESGERRRSTWTPLLPVSSARWSKEAKEGDGGGSSSLSLTSSSAFCRSLDASIWDSSKSSPGETTGSKGVTQLSTPVLPAPYP